MTFLNWYNGAPVTSGFGNGASDYWYNGAPVGLLQSLQEADPDSIASAESWGSPTLTLLDQFLTVGSISSSESWGDPDISFEQFLGPDSIASAESWSDPDIGFEQFLSPDSIPSAEAWETDTEVIRLDLQPASIDSAEAWGTPYISFEQFLSPGTIASVEQWGDPNVCGPCNPDSIETGEAWGTALFKVTQTVTIPTIASLESWGTVQVSIVQSVAPGTIASAEAWGSPKLAATTKPVIPASIESSESWGVLEVNGGTYDLQVFVGGYDRTRWKHRGTLRVDSNTLGRWTGAITFQNVPDGKMELLDTEDEWVPTRGQTILVKMFQQTLFRGCIRQIKASRPLSTDFVLYDCVLADKGAVCDRRIVTKSYQGATDGVEIDVADMVRDVVANFLNGEGIALADDFPASLGPLDSTTSPFIKVSQLFDLVTTLTGLEWFVDYTQKLRFVDPDSGSVCPFEFTETSRNWRNLSVTETDVDYRNRQYVVSNLKPKGSSSLSRTETITLERWGDRSNYSPTPWNDNGGYQPLVNEVGFPPYYLRTQFGIDRIVSVTRNGTPITTRKSSELTPAEYLDFVSGTTFLWVYDGNGSAMIEAPSRNSDTYHPLMNVGDVIVIEYVPTEKAAEVISDPVLEIPIPDNVAAGEQFGTCGSGRYEAVEQVNDVDTAEGKAAIGQALLDRLGVIPKTLIAETDEIGAAVGDRIHVDIPRNMVPDLDMFITGVSFREESSGMDLGTGSIGRWTITATNFPGVGNWIKVWERLYRRTQHPQPLDRIAPTTIFLGQGSALTAGTVPAIGKVNEGAQLDQVVARFGVPPTNQDLVIDVKLDGASIFDSAKLVVPAGHTGDVVLESFGVNPLFGEKDQTVTVSVSYRSTGGTPVAARNGTVVLRWKV